MPEPTVNVPGQRFWHGHECRCGHIWTHKAPTPMTAKQNDEIHTCPKCGAKRYEIDFLCPIQSPQMAAYLVLGVLVVCLIMDR